MRHNYLLAAALAAMGAASGVASYAQGFEGAAIDINTTDISVEDAGDFSLLSFSADAAYSFGNFGVQAGINHVHDLEVDPIFGFTIDYTGYELHLFYDVTEDLRVGAIAALDDFDGNESNLHGIEAIWTPGIGRIEGRLASFDEDPVGGWLYNFSAEAELAQGFSPFIQFRRNNYDDGFGYYFRTELGMSYAPTDMIDIYGSLGRATNDFGGGFVEQETSLNLGLRIHFGGASGDTDRLFRYTGFF